MIISLHQPSKKIYLQGTLDVILSGSTASEKPELRIEEKNYRKNILKSKLVDLELSKDEIVLSFQKTLLAWFEMQFSWCNVTKTFAPLQIF